MAETSTAPSTPTVVGESVSFVLDEDKLILELIRIDEEGALFFREDKGWVEVGDEDAPTIFDQTLADVTESKVEDAVTFYDNSEEVKFEQIADYIS